VTYDHHEKAGNQGDVVKHVALIAALDTILKSFEGDEFRYADTFAGYAYSPLILKNEWENGIEEVFDQGARLGQNPHTKLWYEWYLRGRPHLLGGVYPGSSLIANDVCRLHNKHPHLTLWDISPAVIANLMETYDGQGHRLHPRSARATDRGVEGADFLFVDPPGASMVRRAGFPHWSALTNFFENPEKAILIWLPVSFRRKKGKGGQPDEDIEDTKAQRDDALKRDFGVTVVRWGTGIRTLGCQLFYRLPANATAALKSAVEHVVGICDWKTTLPADIQAVTHMP